jgi:WD40 repeat protein
MNNQTKHLLTFSILLSLVACTTTENRPTATQASKLTIYTSTQKTPSLREDFSTETVTPTSNNQPTLTNTQAEYRLADWKEPKEVIGPDNIDRVVKVGELQFTDVIRRFAWSPDGSRFGASSNGYAFIMDSITFSQQINVEGSFVVFSYDGKILETDAYQYDLETGEQLETGYLYQYPGGIRDIEFSPNGEYLASAGSEYIQIYPMKDSVKLGQFGRYGWSTYHVSVSPDSQLIAVNSAEESFTELWDPLQQKPIRILKIKGVTGRGKPRFSKDGESLFFTGIGLWDGQEASYLQEWDYRTGKPLDIQLLPEIVMDYISPIDLSPKSAIVAFGTREGKIFLMPLRDCKAVLIGGFEPSRTTVYMVAFRPDGKLFATTGFTGNIIELWGIPSSSDSKKATVEISSTPTACPKIPMEVEHPIPLNDWWGGDRRHL